jgi:hypothetical protein
LREDNTPKIVAYDTSYLIAITNKKLDANNKPESLFPKHEWLRTIPSAALDEFNHPDKIKGGQYLQDHAEIVCNEVDIILPDIGEFAVLEFFYGNLSSKIHYLAESDWRVQQLISSKDF